MAKTKALINYTVNEQTFNTILTSYTWKEYQYDLTPYLYGHSKKNCIYYNETDIVLNLAHLSVLGLTEQTDKDHWYQVFLHLNREQEADLIQTIRPVDAIIKINNIIKKQYDLDEKKEIFATHEKEESEIIHVSIDATHKQITKFSDCCYYDANGAYASELIKMFPKCRKDFEYMFEHRHDNNNKWKNCFNYYVGCLTENEKKRQYKIETGKKVRTIYPKTRNYIVQNISDMLLDLIDKVNGYVIYANTDGVMIHKPKNKLPNSKDIGNFKIEYEGDIYTYQGDNYSIVQYGDEIKGSLPVELRKYVDLRVGKVVSFSKKLNSETGTFEYFNIKEEFINDKNSN